MTAHPQPTATGAIAPDTTGLNFFRADRSLADLLQLHLPADLWSHIEPHLDRLGALAGDHLDTCARLADRHTPILHPRDRFGNDVQHIEYHPAYRELERVGFGEFGIHAMSHRKGILGWPGTYPAAAKHAFTYLFNQAEFGMGCPLNVTDGAAMLLARYGDAALQAKYLDRLTETDMSRLTQGAQFMTEKEGGSDVGSLTTIARPEGDHWRLHGDKWFCSNADAGIVMLLARPEGAVGGTRGVGLFLMPRYLDDGAVNSYRIVRLKDKLGTRSMASGEIKLEGALALCGRRHRPRLRPDGGDGQLVAPFQWRQIDRADAPRAARRDDRRARPSRLRPPHHRPAARPPAAHETDAAARAGAVDVLRHRRRARSRRAGRQPGSRGAGAHADAGVEIPRDARRPQDDAATRSSSAAASATSRNSRARGCCATPISARSGRAPATSSRSTRSRAPSAGTAPRPRSRPISTPASTTAAPFPPASAIVSVAMSTAPSPSPARSPRTTPTKPTPGARRVCSITPPAPSMLAWEAGPHPRSAAATPAASCSRASCSTIASPRATRSRSKPAAARTASPICCSVTHQRRCARSPSWSRRRAFTRRGRCVLRRRAHSQTLLRLRCPRIAFLHP